KGRAPGKVHRQRRIAMAIFPGEKRYVCIGKRSEAIKLVGTIDHEKEYVNRCGNFAVGDETPPQVADACYFGPRLFEPCPFKPKRKQDKDSSGDEVQPGGEPRKQVQPQRA